MWFKFKSALGGSDANLRRDLTDTLGSQTESRETINSAAAVTGAGQDRFVGALVVVVLVSAALYFGRIVFEPVAFMLFTMALVEPFQQAAQAKFGKPVALILTILLTLLVLSILIGAIVWSISDIIHWGLANVERFQSLYTRVTQWLLEKEFFVGEIEGLGSFSFSGVFQTVAVYVNYLIGFALVVFLFLAFGLAEMDDFKLKLIAVDKKMIGWSLLETSSRIAGKIRKYMLIRTLASVGTGVAVFLFTLSIGLELAVAWGVISFV